MDSSEKDDYIVDEYDTDEEFLENLKTYQVTQFMLNVKEYSKGMTQEQKKNFVDKLNALMDTCDKACEDVVKN